jgi:excisionase family DNA binding protein
MPGELYSIQQIAGRLGLHVRTVRGYVRSGKLKAVRIGKQYRVAHEDLEAMTGKPASSFGLGAIGRQRHVEVSSIVEVDVIRPETASRLTNMLMAATNSRGPNDEPLRVETIYDEQRARLKVILVGSMESNSEFFKLIGLMLDS